MTDVPKFVREVRETWITIPEAAEKHGIPERRIRVWLRKGYLKGFCIWLDGRYWINPVKFDEFMIADGMPHEKAEAVNTG